MAIQFEWDREKAALNLKKHHVSFEEASTVFQDPFGHIFDDENHSIGERREMIIGHSVLNRLLIVHFVEKSKERIRIFSARLATKTERHDYEEHANY